MRVTFRGVSLVVGEPYDPELRCGGFGPRHAFYVAERVCGWTYGVLLFDPPDPFPGVWLEVCVEDEAIGSIARGHAATSRKTWR